jgi:hypothetical protein
VERLQAEVTGALKRKPVGEARLAGVVRALAPYSSELRGGLVTALETLTGRGSYTRPLYASCARSLAEAGEKKVVASLTRALSRDEGGCLATLSAACFMDDDGLTDSLAKVAISRHPHLAFAAEVARIARRESDGEHIASLAPKIKESHRIELCSEVFVPLREARALPTGIAPALAVLRDSERHLGRWLVLAEIATRASDPGPRREARERAASGPSSARAAWSMVCWALADGETPPDLRPTVELVARLSDRPSSDRDTTFLYRLAEARAPSARAMLESFVKSTSLGNDAAIRAALYLARDHGRADLLEALADVAANPKREALRGLAVAALYDAGSRPRAQEIAEGLGSSRSLTTLAWGGLVRAARGGKDDVVVTESNYRRLQLGWAE